MPVNLAIRGDLSDFAGAELRSCFKSFVINKRKVTVWPLSDTSNWNALVPTISVVVPTNLFTSGSTVGITNGMTIRKADICVCDLCGHEWFSRNGIPACCAKCKSPRWNGGAGLRKVDTSKAEGPFSFGQVAPSGPRGESYPVATAKKAGDKLCPHGIMVGGRCIRCG